MEDIEDRGICRREFNKMWVDDGAVSPVIATILMVAITVVLAGALVVLLPTMQPQDQNVILGLTADIQGSDWVVKVINIQGGSVAVAEASVQIVNSSSGASTVHYPSSGRGIGTGDGSNFDFHDNDGDSHIDSGDSFHIYSNQNVSQNHNFKVFKGNQQIGNIRLP